MIINTILKKEKDGKKEYIVEAKNNDNYEQLGVIVINSTGNFDIIVDKTKNDYEKNQKVIYKELEKLLKELLIGKEIFISSYDDDVNNSPLRV